MSNPVKYIRDLEAVGFERTQAEAQVQMVLEVLEGDLVTKSDFAVFQERSERKFAQFEQHADNRMTQFEQKMGDRMTQFEQKVDDRMTQFEQKVDDRMTQFEQKIDNRMTQFEVKMDGKFESQSQSLQTQIKELEFRMMTRLGLLMVSTTSIAVATLTWLIKV